MSEITNNTSPAPSANSDSGASAHKRSIRSFVIRGGRMTTAQRKALDWGRGRFLIDSEGLLDPSEVFEQDGPLVLEIGFGMGGSLADMALAAPDTRFLGVEVHRPGIGSLLHRIQNDDIQNLRIIEGDANLLIDDQLPANCLDRLQLYFPDPWHKKKHHKRRLLQADFVSRLERVMKAEGLLHMATDWQPYAEWALDVLETQFGWVNTAGTNRFADRPAWRPETRFERRGTQRGHGVYDLIFRWCPA